MDPNYNYINEISMSKMSWNLKVRVIRLWHIPDCEKLENSNSAELIIQDEKGDRIHATIGRAFMRIFKTKIHEMRLYVMKNFVVGPNNLKIKTSKHKLKLTFAHRTSVDEISDPQFSLNIFNFKPYEHLKNQLEIDENELSAFSPVGLGEKKTVRARPKTDNICTVWAGSLHQTTSHRSYSVSEEPAVGNVEVKNIGELIDFMQEGQIWTVANVVNLELEKGWSHVGCKKCSKKVDKTGNKFYCKKCERVDQSALKRLQVRVIDGTGSICLLLWDREETKDVEKSADTLKEGVLETSSAAYECSHPLEKKCLFQE
ncbi:uncharacterized protein [Nicotiana sylvestris]|uniref:uncharacterized protein n=1 Tax=Nicotiana sylvestris TaxID=4096 RepID=UPI00388CC0CE